MANGAKLAVVLLSGGLDSATALAVARRSGFRCHALSVAYGQRHGAELDAARRLARALGRFRVHAPLVQMTKADIIRLGHSLGVDYALTHSCYDPAPDGAACGRCDSCQLRRAGFEAAGLPDPTRYAAQGG